MGLFSKKDKTNEFSGSPTAADSTHKLTKHNPTASSEADTAYTGRKSLDTSARRSIDTTGTDQRYMSTLGPSAGRDNTTSAGTAAVGTNGANDINRSTGTGVSNAATMGSSTMGSTTGEHYRGTSGDEYGRTNQVGGTTQNGAGGYPQNNAGLGAAGGYNNTTNGAGAGEYGASPTSATSGGKASMGGLNYGQGGNNDDLLIAREKVHAAEAAEREALRMLAMARQAVKEAHEHVNRLGQHADEEARRATMRQQEIQSLRNDTAHLGQSI